MISRNTYTVSKGGTTYVLCIFDVKHISCYYNCLNRLFFGSIRISRNANIRLFVCLSDEKGSRALNKHLSLSGQSQDSLPSFFIGKTKPKILHPVSN